MLRDGTVVAFMEGRGYEMGKKFSTVDTYQAAALAVLLDENPELCPSQNGRVSFLFSDAERTYAALARLSAGAPVVCIEFIETLRRLRTEMYEERDRARAGARP